MSLCLQGEINKKPSEILLHFNYFILYQSRGNGKVYCRKRRSLILSGAESDRVSDETCEENEAFTSEHQSQTQEHVGQAETSFLYLEWTFFGEFANCGK